MHEPAIERLTPVFAALGDATRLQLVDRLANGAPMPIVQLAEGLGISHQGVTKHLKVLEAAGLIEARRVGRERQYQCRSGAMHEAQAYLDQVAAQWDDALLRLKAFVESERTSEDRRK